MTPERQSLCSDIAFGCLGGTIGDAIGLIVLSKMKLTIYPSFDYSFLGLLCAGTLIFWMCSLPWEEDGSQIRSEPDSKTKAPE